MSPCPKKPTLLALALLLGATLPVSAIEIEVEFVGNSFFSQNATATAAIEAAAEHVSQAITSTLAPIDQVSFSASAGNTTATLDWGFAFRDLFTNEPIGNLPTVVPDPLLGLDQVKIFVDAQPLKGITIGQGVPSGAQADIGASITGPGGLNGNAIQQVAALADDEMNRGGQAPLIGVLFEGVDNLGGVDVNPIQFRTSFGGILLDNDTNDDDQADTAQQLSDFWHLNHTTAVDANKFDLFSVAVSEIASAIGFGTSDSFEDLATGLNWQGSEVAALIGSGVNVLDPLESSHILSGTLSPRLSDGVVQEVALDPDITAGTRQELTQLDLAFLRDIGFTTVDAGLLPGDYNGDGSIDAADYTVWRQSLGQPGTGLAADGDGSGTVDEADFLFWRTNFSPATPVPFAASASAAVPEPSSAFLLVILLASATNARLRPIDS